MRLQGRTAFVTGASRGIGYELCRQLSMEGARVIVGVRRGVEQTVAALAADRVEALGIIIDTSNRESIQAAIRNLPAPVDVLINNAAILDRDSILSLSDEEMEQTVRTNLIGPMLLAKNLSGPMREKKWGRIVNVTSGMGAISRGLGSDSVAYRVTKLALNGFTICLAESLRGTGVLVNSVDPGWVRTEMGGSMAQRTPEEGARSILHAVLLPDNGPTGVFFRNGRKADW